MNPFHDDDAHIMEVEDHGSNTTEEGAQWIAGLSDGTPDPDSQSDTHASSASPHTSSEEESEDSASDEQPTAHKPSRNPIDSFRLVSGNLQGKLHVMFLVKKGGVLWTCKYMVFKEGSNKTTQIF